MSSSPEIPEIGSPEILEILKIGILATLEAHNFLYRPLIEMRFKE
jgi:hypothetical protein